MNPPLMARNCARHVVQTMRADYRMPELMLSSIALLMGVGNVAASLLGEDRSSAPIPLWVWAVPFLVIAFLQSAGVGLGNIPLRRLGIVLGAVYWVFLTLLMWLNGYWYGIGLLWPVLALSSAWVYLKLGREGRQPWA